MKKYKCMNIGNCENANSGKVFEIAEGEELICPNCKCGSDMLVEVKSSPWKLIAGGLGVAAILGAGAFFVLKGGGGGTSGDVVKNISLNKQTSELTVGTSETLVATVDPADAKATLKWATSDEAVVKVVNGVVTAVASGTAKVGVQVTEQKKLKAFCDYTVKEKDLEHNTGGGDSQGSDGPTPQPNRTNLGFATYDGDMQNGKPHGNGTMTFKKEAVIPGSKGNIKAQAGDYATGTWRNGEVNVVSLYQKGKDPQVIMHK